MRRGYQKIDFLFAKSALFHEYISACVCLFVLPKVNFLFGGGRGADLWGLLRASKWIVSKWNPLLLYACLIQRKGFAVKAYIQLVQSQERANKTKHEITIIPARYICSSDARIHPQSVYFEQMRVESGTQGPQAKLIESNIFLTTFCEYRII